MRHFILLCFVAHLCLLPSRAHADQEKGCFGEDRGSEMRKINGSTVSVKPSADQKEDWDVCVVSISDPRGKVIFRRHDHGIEIVSITGTDINGDGQPDAVIEGYSGGAHCCWTYWIVSVGTRPRLLATIYNERDVRFTKEGDGRVLMETLDGRFDYFDGLCHACTVFPSVYLRLHGDRLEDVSSEFWLKFQTEIDAARNDIDPDELRQFRSEWRKDHPSDRNSFDQIRKQVLTIVLAYLYGGKPDQAWKALDEMWPPQDKQRIRKLILSTRGTGFATRPNN